MATNLPSQDAWTRAKHRYMEDLTDVEKQLYMQATPEMILYDASAAEKRHETSSTSRGLMDKLQPFILAIEQYGQAIDVYANAYPLVLSPLWGSIRVLLLVWPALKQFLRPKTNAEQLLQIAREFGKYFEKLVDMFARIGDVLPRFQVYEKLFPDHQRLTHALSVAYVDIIVFCSNAKAVFRRGQRTSLTSLKLRFKPIWKPFENQFGKQLDKFRIHRKNVEKEAGLSHMVEAADARALVLANHLQLERTKKENERRRIIAMIESSDVEAKHRKLQSLRFNGTGEWVLRDEKYLEWKHASSPSSLCCYGIPGSGKSVLASRIIDDLSITADSSQFAVVYYYCDYADHQTLQTGRILGTILKQLLRVDDIPEELEVQILQAYEDGQRTPWTYEMMDLVCSVMRLRPLVYVVLDGLDECEKQPRQDILIFLNRLSTYGKTSVRTLVSCRDEDQLLRSLDSKHRIQLTATALESDIESFVKGSVRSRIETGQLTIRNPDLEHEIVRELVSKAHGMFLWTFFQLDDLCEALSDAMIRQTLRDLPVGLMQTYERILLKISKSPSPKQQIALRAFRWTVCSRRPMKVGELQEAVAFENSDMSWDRDKIPNENLMIETCRGLLVRDEADSTVRFAHHTVQQYLLSAPMVETQKAAHIFISSRSEAEASVGQLCLTYLYFSDFETQIALRTPNVNLEALGVFKVGGPAEIPAVLGIIKTWLDIPYRILRGKSTPKPLNIDYSKYLAPFRQPRPQVPSALTEKYRLLEYIVEYWMDHTKDLWLPFDDKVRHLAMHKTLSFEFRPWGPNQHFGQYGCVTCSDPTKAKDLPFMSLLHYAAHVGHRSLIESLAAEYCQHEKASNETLLIACRQGHALIVRKLIHSIEFDLVDGRAVSVAVAAGHTEILEFLSVFCRNTLELSKASSSYNIVANASSLLELAVINGDKKMVETIFLCCRRCNEDFDESIAINEKGERTGRTAFFSAVVSGNENIVRFLLSRGAAIKVERNTAIHIAAEYGHTGFLRMLLDLLVKLCGGEGFDLGFIYEKNAKEAYCRHMLFFQDSEGHSPLHKAARNGHTAVVNIILDHQRDVDVPTGFRTREDTTLTAYNTRFTPLHLAACGGHLDVVKVLIDRGASVEAKTDPENWTPLHLAAAEGHELLVEYLLQTGANPYAGAKDGTQVLQVAVSGGHEAVVRSLLDYGFTKLDFNSNNTEMAELIETAAENEHNDVLNALLDWVCIFDQGPSTEILDLARRRGLYRALDVLEDFSQTRRELEPRDSDL